MSPQPAGREFPLSIEQEHLWFLGRLHAQPAIHNRSCALRIRGPLQVDRLAPALELIVERHEPLRTRFVESNGCVAQVVGQPAPIHLEIAKADGQEAATALARDEFLRPFDLSAGPPIRASMLRLASEDHILLLTIHHLSFDGWSEKVLLRELSEIYDALLSGRNPDLTPIATSYGEITTAARTDIEAGRLDDDLDYWVRQLAEPRARLELPTDYPRPATPANRGARLSFGLPGQLSRAIETLGREERATTFTTLLALLATLLNRYSDIEDLIVGCPVAGRHRVESEPLIGLFINTLALRVDLSGNPTFRELLRRTQNTVIAGLSRQRVPFGAIVKRTNPERRSSRAPLFSASFQWRNFPVPSPASGSVRFERFELDAGLSRLDLAIDAQPSGGAIKGAAEFDTDLFERASIERMLAHYEKLAESAVADPDRSIATLAMLSDDERRSTIALWQGAVTDYRPDSAVHQIVEEQVARNAQAIAIVDGARRISYEQMNLRANQLAHRLMALGVTPRSNVGVMLDRSVEYVVSILAILKAGACYVPIDPEWPAPRIRLILDETEAALVVTDNDGRTLGIDEIVRIVPPADAHSNEESDRNPGVPTDPGDPLYVMYTSGSTGRPKGVVIEHRSVNRLLVNTNFVRIRAGDVVAFCSNVAFDGSTFDIWGPLLSGATVVVVPQRTLMSPAEVGALFEREKVTALLLTVSLARIFAHERPAIFRNVQTLLVGGEAVDLSFRTIFGPRDRPASLVNAYGPTEATVFAVAHEIENDSSDSRLIPIGRPIANSIAGILDARGEPVPIGIPGEICLGGPGVARGYLHNPELTAERFIPDRFTGDPGARLYRTGDRGRFRNDGRIEFLGRFDNQIKIRGYRIEPAEIEAALASHPAVDQAIVAPVGTSNEKRLAAWVTLHRAIDPLTLRSYLRKTLPDFMIPSRIIPIERVTLTPNGKLDTAALPLPVERRESPREMNETENAVREVWIDVLGHGDASVDVDFFDAGGDSINALRFLSSLQQRFGREVPVDTFFRVPTIEAVAAFLESDRLPPPKETVIVPIHSDGPGSAAFLLPGGAGGEWNLLVLTPFFRLLSNERPVYGIRSPLLLDSKGDITELVDRHTEVILSLKPDPPWILLGECIGGILAWEIAARLETEHPGSVRLVLLDTRYPDAVKRARFEARVAFPVTVRERVFHHARSIRKGQFPKLTRILKVITGIEPLDDAEARLYQQRYGRFLLGIDPSPRNGDTFFLVSSESGIVRDVPRWRKLSTGESRMVSVPGDHSTYLNQKASGTARALDEILASP